MFPSRFIKERVVKKKTIEKLREMREDLETIWSKEIVSSEEGIIQAKYTKIILASFGFLFWLFCFFVFLGFTVINYDNAGFQHVVILVLLILSFLLSRETLKDRIEETHKIWKIWKAK